MKWSKVISVFMKKRWQTKNNTLLVILLSCWVSEGGIQQVNRSLLKLFAQFEDCDVSVLVLVDQQVDIESATQQNPNIKKKGLSLYHLQIQILIVS